MCACCFELVSILQCVTLLICEELTLVGDMYTSVLNAGGVPYILENGRYL